MIYRVPFSGNLRYPGGVQRLTPRIFRSLMINPCSCSRPLLRVSLALSALIVSAGAFADTLTPRGVSNFYVVNEQVYRGAQPSDQGFANLARMGIKTVLDLRDEEDRSKEEKKLVKALGMRYETVPMQGMKTPSDKQIKNALKVLNDPKAWPVFVHCKRGADRTGAVIACYRVGHDGWSNAAALTEARKYGMSWYQFQLKGYVSSYEPPDESIAAGLADKAEDLADKSVGLFKSLGRQAAEAVGKVGH